MITKLSYIGWKKQADVCMKLGVEELLGRITEECGELVQAAQKYRRVLNGTTTVSLETAIENLCEECADVVLCIDMLIRSGLVDEAEMHTIGRIKNDREYKRIDGKVYGKRQKKTNWKG